VTLRLLGRESETNDMTQFTGAPIFDADQHMYETADALVKHLPKRYERAVQYAQFGRQTRIVINNRVTDFIPPNPTFERVVAPGAHEKFFAGMKHRGSDAAGDAGQGHRGARRHPQDRIVELDRQGVREALKYPTLGSLVEHSAADDPQLQIAIIHALNAWLAEHWSYAYEDRIFSTAIIRYSDGPCTERRSFQVLHPPLLIIQRGASLATTSG
jgi:hypothetical protein